MNNIIAHILTLGKENVDEIEKLFNEHFDSFTDEQANLLADHFAECCSGLDLVALYDYDFHTYCSYNIQDVRLVTALEHRLHYIMLGIEMTYKAKCHFKDVFGTVGIWDCYLYGELLNRKMLAPPKRSQHKQKFPGGFNYLAPEGRGLKRNVMVYDIASSYPNNIISYNISPETILDLHTLPKELQDLSMKWGEDVRCLDVEVLLKEVAPTLKKFDVCMAPNGTFFSREKVGFMAEIVSGVFQGRKAIRREMAAWKKELDEIEKELASRN